MICDAHVHMGYYSRKGYAAPYYYSPRRIFGVLKRCGVDEFIVSSTCAQIASIRIDDIVREAKEIRRLAGRKAHVFFWLSGHLYDEDPKLGWMSIGLFDGIKLHEGETPWVGERFRELRHVIEMAEERNLPIQMHAGATGVTQPRHLKVLARQFPRVRFDFAHCRPMDEMVHVVAECPNVWTDTAYWSMGWFEEVLAREWRDRLLFGTDLPVWQAREDVGLTKRYRDYVNACRRTGLFESMRRAFRSFVRGA